MEVAELRQHLPLLEALCVHKAECQIRHVAISELFGAAWKALLHCQRFQYWLLGSAILTQMRHFSSSRSNLSVALTFGRYLSSRPTPSSPAFSKPSCPAPQRETWFREGLYSHSRCLNK